MKKIILTLLLCLIIAVPVAGTAAYAASYAMYQNVSSSYDYGHTDGEYVHSGYFTKGIRTAQSKLKLSSNNVYMTASITLYSNDGKSYSNYDQQTSSSLNKAISATRTANLFSGVNRVEHYTTASGILGISTLTVIAS